MCVSECGQPPEEVIRETGWQATLNRFHFCSKSLDIFHLRRVGISPRKPNCYTDRWILEMDIVVFYLRSAAAWFFIAFAVAGAGFTVRIRFRTTFRFTGASGPSTGMYEDSVVCCWQWKATTKKRGGRTYLSIYKDYSGTHLPISYRIIDSASSTLRPL